MLNEGMTGNMVILVCYLNLGAKCEYVRLNLMVDNTRI